MTLDPAPAYPAARAFVLKLHQDARPRLGIWRGRIEAIASGRQHEFRTSDELLTWLSQLTPDPQPAPAARGLSSPFLSTDGDPDE